MELVDLTGRVFGRLTVTGRDGHNKYGARQWACSCSCGNTYVTVSSHLTSGRAKSCGCQLRESASKRRGVEHPRWKGGRYVHIRTGYVNVRVTDYPGSEGTPVLKFEHQYVYAKHLGRPIASDESIHHKNGNPSDNRLENLELKVSFHGQGSSIEEAVAHARTVLERYAPELLR